MTKRVLLGMLTPSSNTALEPITTAMLGELPEVSAHFSRFKVTEIALSNKALAQFDNSEILRAAELLAHAKVDVIGWNGTSSGWLGFEADVRLCEQITAATGIPATTSMLALNEILEHQKVKRLGYVTPYLDDVQARILENYEKLGFACQGERHLGLQDNFSFSEVPVVQLEDMTRDVAKEKPDAITIICTNLRVAPSAAKLERETGIPVYDTIATVVWKCLKMAGVDTKRVTQWGSLFQQV
ncbi:maleate cis-trans isomerase family protein [Tardiphaga sp. 215_C5_N2_1]|jgi:maleate isomerase|uniref:maleate cis-trans isomerase family protein n=1 Tax=Tardiphaga TaxID=1395974 RepID=UPI001586CC00|nr:aspartate/glutamate racemase family protein [Tardiphaga robiniae]NUU43275.1 Asp/Glu/hydantoin racemase [Tardiphaga robiniae]